MARGSPDWRQFAPQKSYEQLSREQNAFCYNCYCVGVAGVWSWTQIYNPPASGVHILLFAIAFRNDAVSGIQLGAEGSAITTLVGNGFNLYQGGPASIAEVRKDNILGSCTDLWLRYYPEADFDWMIKNPYIWIPPGGDIVIQNVSVNNTIWVNYHWFEIVDF